MTHRPLHKYDIDGNEKLLMEGDENHHHMLFWGGESGIEMMLSYIRVELVMIAVYRVFPGGVGAGAPAVHHGRIPRLYISNNPLCGGSGARCIAHKRLSRFTTKLCYRYKRRGTNQSQGNQPHVAHYEIKKCNACVTQHELFHAQCRPNGEDENDALTFTAFPICPKSIKKEILDTCEASDCLRAKQFYHLGK